MITVACVNHGNYLGMGEEYVARMQAMVKRNLHLPYQFVCLKDEGDEDGWWSKIELFKPGRFKGRVLYFDLDSVVVGNLHALAAYPGIIDLTHWGWKTHTLCSTVMVWDGDEHANIYTEYSPNVRKAYRGDQDWITAVGGWEVLAPGLCKSYRYHCKAGPPAGCIHVSMHGQPKPHEIEDAWVKQAWRV